MSRLLRRTEPRSAAPHGQSLNLLPNSHSCKRNDLPSRQIGGLARRRESLIHAAGPHHRFNYFRFHNWIGYIALAVSILHPVILLFNKDPHFRIRDLVYPVQSPSQPLHNTIGAIALYLLAFAVVTSYLRIRLGRHLWKAATAANSSSNLACSSSPPAACCACALPAKSPTCPPSRSADSQRHVSVVGKKR